MRAGAPIRPMVGPSSEGDGMKPNGSQRSRFWIPGLVAWVLLGIGMIHSVVGLSAGRPLLLEIAREGFWNTVRSGSAPLSRPLLQWFLVSGFVLLMLGHLALWVERRMRKPLPVALGV